MVAEKLGLGGLVFLVGRFAFVAVHELAHGLAMASFGRRVSAPGSSRVDLPVCVRRHVGGVVRAAAPADRGQRRRAASSDFSLGACSRSAASRCPTGRSATSSSSSRSGLRRRDLQPQPVPRPRRLPHPRGRAARAWAAAARARAVRAPAGGAAGDGRSPVLARYSLAGLVWSVVAALFAIGCRLRYEPVMLELAPRRRRVGRAGHAVGRAVRPCSSWSAARSRAGARACGS